MRYSVWILIIILIILHQDNWLWEDERLIFGFFPIALLHHAVISVCAGLTWFLATRFAWPVDLEDNASATQTEEREEA